MNDLIPFRIAVSDTRREQQLVITRARRWGISAGQPFDPDLLALVLAGVAQRSIEPWTRRGVYSVLRSHIFNWCDINRCLCPEGVPETLWRWLHFVDATDGFGAADEPLSELIKPLLCYGGLDYEGRPRPEDSPKLIECECSEPMLPQERADMELWRSQRERRMLADIEEG